MQESLLETPAEQMFYINVIKYPHHSQCATIYSVIIIVSVIAFNQKFYGIKIVMLS